MSLTYFIGYKDGLSLTRLEEMSVGNELLKSINNGTDNELEGT